MACRACVWLYWFGLTVLTGTYAALSLVTFFNIYRAYDDENNSSNEELRAILAATIFGCVLVAAFAVFSFLILLGKTLMATGAGFGYGLLLSSSLHMAVTSLLCALVMHGFEDTVKDELEKVEDIDWQGLETNTYEATWSFAYMAAGVYLVFFIWLFLAPGAFRKEERERDEKDEAA